MKQKDRESHVIKDFAIIVFSIIIAIILAKTGILERILTSTSSLRILGSFFAGAFFTSIFSVAPATVVIAEIAKTTPVLEVAFFGGIGALLGDLIIFRFIKDNLAEDFFYLIKKTKTERWLGIFRLKLFKRLVPLIGAIIIASPLPDELGLAMMGLSKVRTSLFVPISFSLNFFGILIISLIARVL